MIASNIKDWANQFKPGDWPAGVLDKMDSLILTDIIFPLRIKSGIAMWPSAYYDAHIRETGTSQHSIECGRLSTATDMHVATITKMMRVMAVAETILEIGGIGVYFDTNTPMLHLDARKNRLVWLRYKNEFGELKYLYRENDYVKFYKKLGGLL